MSFKVIIAGGRDFNDYALLEAKVSHELQATDREDIEIVSGCQRGADTLGEEYAKSRKIPIKPFPALWGKYGYSAGPIRNQQMADYADALIAFWDGRSRGTSDMIRKAKAKGLRTIVISYNAVIL